MSQLGQGQVGKLKSMPKLTRINGDDSQKVIYRNLGNNHAYPFLWATSVTHSGTETVLVASGVKFHGYDLLTYANVTVTPIEDPGAGVSYWIDKNTSDGKIYIKSSGSMDNIDFDVKFMLGVDMEISGIYCRPMTSSAYSAPRQSYP
jgi:hypothetical protein